MQTKTKFFTLVAAGLILSVATAAVALDVAAVEKARGDFFHSIGKPFKALNEELKKPAPDIAVIRTLTSQIATTAPQLPAQFPAGSDPQGSMKSEVLPAIWSNPADFKQKNDAFQTAVVNLNQAAQKGDISVIGAAVKATGETCKSCHTTYRKEDH